MFELDADHVWGLTEQLFIKFCQGNQSTLYSSRSKNKLKMTKISAKLLYKCPVAHLGGNQQMAQCTSTPLTKTL